jgi:hypothetical protein
MRTTLDIADDVLLAVKEAARRQKTSVGALMSDLVRRGLMASAAPSPQASAATSPLNAYGIFPRPRRGDGVVVTNELINRLRDDDIY